VRHRRELYPCKLMSSAHRTRAAELLTRSAHDLSLSFFDPRVGRRFVETCQTVDVPPERSSRSHFPAGSLLDGKLGAEVDHDPVPREVVRRRLAHT
jgi:hypothetical protein